LVFFCAGNDQLRIHRSLSIDFICIFVPYGQICGKSNSEPAGDQLTEQWDDYAPSIIFSHLFFV
jgi:hypothetical protein